MTNTTKAIKIDRPSNQNHEAIIQLTPWQKPNMIKISHKEIEGKLQVSSPESAYSRTSLGPS